MVMEMVWRPRVASSEHGALQSFSGFPSNVAVAPAGLLMIDTGWVAAMAGAGLAEGFRFGPRGRPAGGVLAVSAGVVEGGGMGLGFGSTGVGAAVVAGGAASTGGGAGGLVACTWLESHGAACQPISASRPAATRIANRNGRKPAVRRSTRSVVVAPSAKRARRAGGRITTGLAESAMVGSFKLPPRGMVFQPLLAAHAFSSAPANSWQVG